MGVDNVDVVAATRRGIVVANAPESNVVTAAEHTMALLLALARNVPQAYASLIAGNWERSKFSGVELYEKTLGILGFGRIGQLVAQRARGFGMRVLAFDPFVSAERYRELGVEKADGPGDIYAQADFITIHLPKTPETEGFVDADAFAAMRPGARILNVARGGLIDEAALKDALDAGTLAGAALDVFPSEPVTEHPLFGYPNVVVTPHLGASTAEATDRAGYQSAEQVVAALTGGVVSTAVNIPAIGAEDMETLGPFLPLATQLGRLAMALAEGSSVERIEAAFLGRIADFDTRLLGLAVIVGALAGTHRGAGQPRQRPHDGPAARDRVRGQVGVRGGGLQRADPRDRDRRRRARRGRGHRHRPQPAPAPGRGAGQAPDDRARAARDRVPLRGPARDDRQGRHDLRCARDQHLLGGRRAQPRRARRRRRRAARRDGRHDRRAVPAGVLSEIIASEGFDNGWSVELGREGPRAGPRGPAGAPCASAHLSKRVAHDSRAAFARPIGSSQPCHNANDTISAPAISPEEAAISPEEVAQRAETGRQAARALLREHPDALIYVQAPDGQVLPPPASLGLEDVPALLAAKAASGMDLCVAEDRMAPVNAWIRVRTQTVAEVRARMYANPEQWMVAASARHAQIARRDPERAVAHGRGPAGRAGARERGA